tara:strand:+ start:327 stop:476 length:150 start_codon:yes stop_codon:yes gene_type:complete
MAKKKAESKPGLTLEEIQEWNRKIRGRIKKAKEANKDASNSNKTVRKDD